MKKAGFLVVTILILVLGISMTVKAASQRTEDITFSKEQYRMMEEEYLEEVRDILLEKGCKNAGITLTYVTDEIGNRKYTVTAHHTKLEKMDAQQLLLLQARIQESAERMLFAEVELKQL